MHSLSFKLRLLLGVILVAVGLLFLNHYLHRATLQAEQAKLLIASAHGQFLELTAEELRALSEPARLESVANGYDRLRISCSGCHPPQMAVPLQQRQRDFQCLETLVRGREQRLEAVERALFDLSGSVRYIHEHHVAHLKNLLRRGVIEQDYDPAASFRRSDNRSASELDIIAAAVAIHHALLEVFGVFRELRAERRAEIIEGHFGQAMRGFLDAVNTFEDFSLDAQDGLLVEELLLNGRAFEQSFRELVASEAQRRQLLHGLRRDGDVLAAHLSDLHGNFVAESDATTGRIRIVQAVTAACALLFVGMVLRSGRRLLAQVRRTVTETQRVRSDLTYRIRDAAGDSPEFRVVFQALNSMAAQIGGQLEQLQQASAVLENRVQERTRDLSAANSSLAQEVQERRQVEAALRHSEERFRGLFENATDLILSVSAGDLRVEYANPAWLRTLGYGQQELGSITLLDVVPAEAHERWQEVFRQLAAGGSVGRFECVLLARGGATILAEGAASCVSEAGAVSSFQAILRDVTAQRRMEEELLRAAKLDSIGVLAGGLAHDFNNLLTGVMGNINLATLQLPAADPARTRLEQAEKALLRATELTQQLLTFSKGGEPIKRTTDIRELLRETTEFALSGSNVRCRCRFAEDLWPAEVDPGQLSQVVSNIALNADQAMPDGGSVVVAADNWLATDADETLTPGEGYVHITVTDRGPGIPVEIRNRIFDPYFTTKDAGSGLGLATAYSIVRRHGGQLRVESGPGKGSCFHIFVPAGKAEQTQSATEAEVVSLVPQGRVLRILVMDDDALVRRSATDLLQASGYRVSAAADGEEAVAMYREAMGRDPFDVVIMDLTVPGGMGGREAVERMLAIDPQVCAVVSSGYANDPIMAEYQRFGFCAVLPKPYRMQALLAALQRAQAARN